MFLIDAHFTHIQTQWTPLMIASSAGHTQCVYCFLGHGAQVNAVNSTGQSSLHYASSKDHVEVIVHHFLTFMLFLIVIVIVLNIN